MKPEIEPAASNRAVLWDMDGVLVDSGEQHFQAWRETLEALGIPFDRQKFCQTFGMNNTGILTVLTGHTPNREYVEMVSDQKEGRFRELIKGGVYLLPFVRYWLDLLQQGGYLLAVASSAPPANLDALVEELHIRKYFEVIVSAYAMPGKPDPAVFLEAACRLEVPPERCVVVEDSIAGVEAAKRAGMKCLAITTTNLRRSLSRADVVVDSLEELTLEDFV